MDHTHSSNKLLKTLTKKEFITLQKNYAINNTLIEKGLYPKNFKPVVKFFNPAGVGAWYLSELSPEIIGFGVCHIHEVELGYVCLEELAALKLRGGLTIVKDQCFSNKGLTLDALLERLKKGEHF